MSEKRPYQRPQVQVLRARLLEKRRFMQVVAGPRQVGKSTMVLQATDRLPLPVRYASADEPTLRGTDWIAQQWEAARLSSTESKGAVLVLDEIQKIPNWSETVKRFWDEDTRAKSLLKVVILGSAPLLIDKGLTESMAGRFEKIHLSHWSYAEMKQAFGLSLDTYLFYGGYPGAAELINQPDRWRRYILDSLVETSISRDVMLLTRVDKPALLRRVFELGCRYSGQILSYTKMLGQLQDAGNTVTLAHYLKLLEGAGLVRALPKYAGDVSRTRASSPKLQVFNTALLSVASEFTIAEAKANPAWWGRLVESALGAHLINAEQEGTGVVHYWREGNHEVDFVVQSGRSLTAIEVKSGRAPTTLAGTARFVQSFKPKRTLMVGGDGIALEEFLLKPVSFWCKQ